MIHKLKKLGMALVMAVALGAVMACSALAAGAFTGEAGKTITGTQINGSITGKVTNKFELATSVGTFKCEEVTFDGTTGFAQTAEQTLTPAFNKCLLAGTIPVAITMNSCDFLFTAGNTVVATDANTIAATVHIVCPPGKVIDVHATAVGNNCHITFEAQNNLSGIELHNRGGAGSAMDVESTIDIAGLSYVVHGSECINGPFTTELTKNGTLKGVATIQSTASSVGITVH